MKKIIIGNKAIQIQDTENGSSGARRRNYVTAGEVSFFRHTHWGKTQGFIATTVVVVFNEKHNSLNNYCTALIIQILINCFVL